MEKQIIKLVKKEIVAEGTMMFTFERPKNFIYKAGQSVDLTLINPPETDAEGNIRSFSLVSAPFENRLSFATRMRDTAFKRVIRDMPLNAELELAGPFGSFTLHKDSSKPAIFLVGGIGITPFYSMIKTASIGKLPHKIFLFYSNRRPEDTAFLSQLTDMQKDNSNYKLIATMSEMEKSKMNWTGETGFINKEMINKYFRYTSEPIYYSAGPPEMVAAMRKILIDMGADEDNIRTEEFSGY
jgi:ferredoxin-NADP reductase